MTPKSTPIDLSLPAEQRWVLSNEQVDSATKMAAYYYQDLASATDMIDQIELIASQIIPTDYLSELKSLAQTTDLPIGQIILCNSYYDLIKPLIGCTAFAFDGADGPVQARNLDWWTENNLLSDCSELFHFIGAPAGEFYALSWPGYIGILSGFAPKRFAITLNAVISPDPFELAQPISLTLRDVFETCHTYEDAVASLQNATLPADCLLLLSGPNTGQYCVIERTPKRQVTRQPENGFIAVTNGYRALDVATGQVESNLQATSDDRYDRICDLNRNLPASLETCLEYLSDPAIFMNNMTVQQMAFCVRTGEIIWRQA